MPGGAPPERVVTGLIQLYDEAEYSILRVLAETARKSSAGRDLVAKATEANRLRAAAVSIANQLTAGVAVAMPEMMTAAAEYGDQAALADLAEVFGPTSRPAGRALDTAALNSLGRSLADTLTPTHLAITRVVDDVYKDVVGRSTAGMLTGTATRLEATQRAMDRFAAAGVTGFVDKRGRSWQLSSYAEMAVRTAAARASVDAHVSRLQQGGVELIYVSDSPQECGLCRPFEHKVVSLDGTSGPAAVPVTHGLTDEPVEVDTVGSLDFIRAQGFQHPNCTHDVAPYLPGVTKLKPAEKTENPDGYRDRQQLRALERKVRAAKRVEAAAMSPAAAKVARASVRAAQSRIRDHVKETGLLRQAHREQLVTGDAAAARP